MLLSPVTVQEMQGAQIVSGATIAGFLAARFMGSYARPVRMALTCLYIATLVGFLLYHLIAA